MLVPLLLVLAQEPQQAAPSPVARVEVTPSSAEVQVGQAIQMIPVEDVLFFISDEKYTRVQTASLEALIRKPIKELVDELDPKQAIKQLERKVGQMTLDMDILKEAVRPYRPSEGRTSDE